MKQILRAPRATAPPGMARGYANLGMAACFFLNITFQISRKESLGSGRAEGTTSSSPRLGCDGWPS